MGYEYELLKAFSREHGLTLVMEVVKNQKTLYQRLNRGEGDIVAARIIPKQEDEGKVSFTHALYRTAPALVQQKSAAGSSEPRFKPDAKSWAGATGLLQLMPATGQEFGVQNLRDPEDNVRGAVKFLIWLTNYWSKRIDDKDERLKFILASYNCGAGHVEDAQRLAEKYGSNPQDWDDCAYWLLQESKVQYSEDLVVRYGFCRGIEPVTYVSLILKRFDLYRRFVTA